MFIRLLDEHFARHFESYWRETWRHTGRRTVPRFPWRHLPPAIYPAYGSTPLGLSCIFLIGNCVCVGGEEQLLLRILAPPGIFMDFNCGPKSPFLGVWILVSSILLRSLRWNLANRRIISWRSIFLFKRTWGRASPKFLRFQLGKLSCN